MRAATRLNALRAIEATARLGGYAAAADEIGVTPEAIGQLVRGLERDLEVPLFRRSNAGARLEPVDALRGALPAMSEAFRTLAATLDALREAGGSASLVVSASPSLASTWLVPRLPGFLAEHPGVDVRLDVTEREADLDAGEADVALRFGAPVPDGPGSITLVAGERLIVVASPDRLDAHGTPATDAELAAEPLIGDETVPPPHCPGWSGWFAAGGTGRTSAPALVFNASLPAIEATRRGQGIALLREQLVLPELRAGTLSRLFPDRSLATGRDYRLLTAARPRPVAARFARWFVEAFGPVRRHRAVDR